MKHKNLTLAQVSRAGGGEMGMENLHLVDACMRKVLALRSENRWWRACVYGGYFEWYVDSRNRCNTLT